MHNKKKNSSCEKLLSQFENNLAQIVIGQTSTKISYIFLAVEKHCYQGPASFSNVYIGNTLKKI